MVTKFAEALGGKLGERAVALVATPAFLFFGGGLSMWMLGPGSPARLHAWFTGRDTVEQITLGALALLAIGVAGLVVQRVAFPVLQTLEGYGPLWLSWLRQRARKFWVGRKERLDRKWQKLANTTPRTAEQELRYVELDQRLRRFPERPGDVMPTRLGNVLRAAELRIDDRYGLEVSITWPRLWLLLPESCRTELSTARATLNGAVANILWGALFLVWTPVHWAAVPIGLTWAAGARIGTLTSAAIYADLVEGTYDLYRFNLYTTLRRPLPTSPDTEPACGQALTAELLRGAKEGAPSFTTPPPVSPDRRWGQRRPRSIS
jgi:hypothetical protein